MERRDSWRWTAGNARTDAAYSYGGVEQAGCEKHVDDCVL